MLMLIDTRPPPDDGGGAEREPWLVTVLGWLLPWPATIAWLCLASRLLEGWVGVVAIFVAIAIAAWRGLCALPSEGLNQRQQ